MNNTVKSEFKRTVRRFSKKIGIEVKQIVVRPMSNKWASCSTNGHLSFNSELLKLEKKLWNYVIVHELLHFNAPNHGKLWKSLMKAYLGNYEILEEKLKQCISKLK